MIFYQWPGSGVSTGIHDYYVNTWTFTNKINRSIYITTNSGRRLVEVGDWVIINDDGSYYNDLRYLPRYVPRYY